MEKTHLKTLQCKDAENKVIQSCLLVQDKILAETHSWLDPQILGSGNSKDCCSNPGIEIKACRIICVSLKVRMGLSLEIFVKWPKTCTVHKMLKTDFTIDPASRITEERTSRWQSLLWDHRQGSLHCLEFISRTFSFFSWYLKEHFSTVDWISLCGSSTCMIYCSLLFHWGHSSHPAAL